MDYQSDHLDDLEDSEFGYTLTDKEVFTLIWTKPRQVFTFIGNTGYDKYFIVLLVLAGISNAFDRSISQSTGNGLSLWAVIALCVFMGGLLGWILYYLYGWVLSVSGRWLNGKARSSELVKILAYGSLPSIMAMVLVIPQVMLYGNEIFKSSPTIYLESTLENVIYYSIFGLETILGLWSIVLVVVGISVIQEFSIGMAILNLILAILLIILPFVFIGIALVSLF